MDLIGREELKEKLERDENVKLVMALGEWAYRAEHIPGSMHLDAIEEAPGTLGPEDEIVVYDAWHGSVASLRVCRRLEARGYKHVRRYAGGLEDWEEAGYPVEGDLVAQTAVPDLADSA